MSEERRPPVPAPPADPTATADTPREGTPAFGDTPVDGSPTVNDTDEVEVLFEKDTVPLVGPSPDHASEYVPPRPLPKPADHKTIENIPIQISPEADPRRAMTQKAMRVLKREDAQRQLMLMGVDATAATPDARVSEASLSDAEGGGKSRAGLYIGGAMVGLIVLALVYIVVQMVAGEPDLSGQATSASTQPPAPAPVRTAEATAKPTAAAPSTAPVLAPPVEPSATTKRKPKPKPGTPKPINE